MTQQEWHIWMLFVYLNHTRGEYYRGSTFIKILEKIKSPGYAPGL